ncbi:MAG TPA: hypothetical protein VFU69_03335 [Ktedonobacterales bacterium]|nr:hypothetical protein [Ktedonobacterales bacterium]
MPAPHQPDQRAKRQNVMRWLRRLRARKWWDRQDPYKQGPAWVMVAFGLICITLALVAVINRSDIYAGMLLLFGCGLVIFGSPLLLFALVEWTASQFIYDKKYCGRCASYQPKEENYAVGFCQASPNQGYVARTHSCPLFRYSERAMVRDRLWQQRYVLSQIRIIQDDGKQTGSDD